ncbi:IS110 family transposase [Candidatus Poriferisocius sp.]|uniref:IS110 family transposase n=1 Tax=Candidatus Poriferisocius sp. TaxID=3101276 RepID=UPI003B024226
MKDQAAISVDVFVGVDIAKQDHWACAITAEGDELFSRAVANDECAIDAQFDEIQAHGTVAVIVDTTSPVAHLLLRVAAERQVPVAYVRGTVMRQAAGTYAGEAKTDPKDAFVLADYARRNTDRLTWLEVEDPQLTRLRLLNSRDVDLATDANRAVQRLRQALTAVSPALERVVGKQLASTAGVRDLLEHWPTPSALQAVGRARIRSRIAKRSPRSADKLADAIWSALGAQTVAADEEETWGEIIVDLAGDINRVNSRRNQIAKDIKAIYKSHPLGKVLDSMCGFGPRTGPRVLAEIGNPHRFETGAQLASYAGLAPVDRQSGRTKTTRRSKGGNHRLKNAMFFAAFVAKRHDPAAKAHYEKKRAEGKSHKAAVISVARKRCDIILAMLKTQTPYRRPQLEELALAA